MKANVPNSLKWGVPALSPRTMSLLLVMLPCCSALVAASTIRYEVMRREQCKRDLAQADREYNQLASQLGISHPSAPADHDDDDHDGHHG